MTDTPNKDQIKRRILDLTINLPFIAMVIGSIIGAMFWGINQAWSLQSTNTEMMNTIKSLQTNIESVSRNEESDKAVRVARLTSLADEVFGDDEKAGRWLRKPKQPFDKRCPLEMLRTEAGARIVEEMLLQLDYGFFA